MGKRHQLGNIFQAITGIMTGTKTVAADINSIGTVQNSFAGNGGIARRALTVQADEKIRSHSYPVAEKWRLF